ncbi:transmembrane protein, putative (macronuclear) [Tetrahymena thermophila SB210]|uniref:Transmembrane protein, putative n=1 Tax=Tetrahymena thermophila (strain SB210) TaxID=312017 RepID=W7XGK0_TETTS|nr:transmembrane protein, putative [Tetrahymena thermophila SB210]EWS72044.1 transmembrane protein, putative [Tetrahymena thermophila SB210]|eukprot:XP_012655419.1 transmembrane protein, putative [Tetrahymena thermophila SB210]
MNWRNIIKYTIFVAQIINITTGFLTEDIFKHFNSQYIVIISYVVYEISLICTIDQKKAKKSTFYSQLVFNVIYILMIFVMVILMYESQVYKELLIFIPISIGFHMTLVDLYFHDYWHILKKKQNEENLRQIQINV